MKPMAIAVPALALALWAAASPAPGAEPDGKDSARKLSGGLRGLSATGKTTATAAQSAFAAPGAETGSGERNFRVEVEAGYRELTGSAAFMVANASQANHVQGGDKPFLVRNRQAEGVEFKKWGFIVNILPVLDPVEPGWAKAQLQVELSGPLLSGGVSLEGQPDKNRVPEIATSQLQTEFRCALGRKTLVSESPLRVEVTLSESPPGR